MSWRRVNGNRKCMICGKPDWCCYTDDGAHRCMRVDGAPGFTVIKRSDDGGIIYRMAGDVAPPTYRAPKPKPEEADRPAFQEIWARCFSKCTYQMAETLAKALGTGRGSTLSMMGLGWHLEQQVWVFPMYACDMTTILGLRTRDARGNKKAILGSRQGLFGAPTSLEQDQVLVCEGPTDTAAALELGFSAIGRPSCSGATDMLRDALRDKHVVIMSDSDAPGRRGADKLAKAVRATTKSVKIARLPSQDMRTWFREGATREAVDFLISNTRRLSA